MAGVGPARTTSHTLQPPPEQAPTHTVKLVSRRIGIQEPQHQVAEPEEQKSNIPPGLGGVGVVFEDKPLQYPPHNEILVKKVFEGSPAQATGKIKHGDSLTEINGDVIVGMRVEDVIDLVIGPIGTSVVLGFRSVDDNQVYDCVMMRAKNKVIGPLMSYNQFEDETARPQPNAVSPEPMMPHSEPEPEPVGPQATVGFSVQEDQTTGTFIVAGIAPQSSAWKTGFKGMYEIDPPEVLEAVDNDSVAGWTLARVKKALLGPHKSFVQIQTNYRTVPVNRDCAPEDYRPQPPVQLTQQPMMPMSQQQGPMFQSFAPPGAQMVGSVPPQMPMQNYIPLEGPPIGAPGPLQASQPIQFMSMTPGPSQMQTIPANFGSIPSAQFAGPARMSSLGFGEPQYTTIQQNRPMWTGDVL